MIEKAFFILAFVSLFFSPALIALHTAWPCPCGGPLISPGLVREPRTYEMWRCDIGSNASALLLLRGERGGLLVAVVEEPGEGWRILGLDVSNGSVLAEASVLGGGNALATVGPFLAIATNESLLLFNTSLGLTHEHIWQVSDVSFFQALGDEELIFAHGRTISCFSIENMSVRWSFSFENASDLCVCLLPEEGVIALRYEDGAWRGCILWSDGSMSHDLDVLWLNWADGVRLCSFNSTHFLLSGWNETYRCLFLVRSRDLSPAWAVELGPDGREGPFVLSDLDAGGSPDVLVWCSGRYRVLSGEHGSELYQLLGLDSVKAVEWLRKRIFAILSDGGVRAVELGRSPGDIRWLWEEEGSLMCRLPDLDGDGHDELAISRGRDISCFWGSYDDEAPVISDLWPEDGLSTSFTNIALVAHVADAQSGVRHVVFKIDGEPVPTSFDEARGLYVADVKLGEGVHVWCVEAEDRVGYVAISEARRLVINLSFFGGPGWLDDIAFFSSWAVVLSIGGVILFKTRGRKSAHSSPKAT